MIQIQQVKLRLGHTEKELWNKAAKLLKISPAAITSLQIRKRSIDARKKPDIYYVYTVWVELDKDENKVLKRFAKDVNIMKAVTKSYILPKHGTERLRYRPVVIGMGPAGLFCALLLAREGYAPLVLERGLPVEERTCVVEKFWADGTLNPDCNVQFGEGGAGTFSDGKLNTMVKDSYGRGRWVLEMFVQAGAPEEILYSNKPHIGTDVLQRVVQNLRQEMIRLGAEVRFSSKVTDFEIVNGRLTAVEVNHSEWIQTQVAILALGHSARDTFALLKEKKVDMEKKSFAVGFRIEHPQSMIDKDQYGILDKNLLPAADYKVTAKSSNGRGVYSFCMCPGGSVVNSSSEMGMLAVNGMSSHARDGQNANSALIVTVTPNDYSGADVLAGVEFQRQIETKAYQAGSGRVPVQLYGDFRQGVSSSGPGEILPDHKGAYSWTDLQEILPKALNDSLKEGIAAFGEKIQGFDRYDAVLSGVESRTSSPIKIVRNEQMESSVAGLYPCGEGPGYAGGIMSAAMDGCKAAEKIVERYRE